VKNETKSRLQIIELSSVYQQLENPKVRTLFTDMLLMRKRGYSSRHRFGALPVDTYDFIGTHYILMMEDNEKQVVLGCIRMVTLSQVQIYHLAFPAISLFSAAKASRHLDFLNQLIQTRREESPSAEFTYVSNWSFDPIARNYPEILEQLHHLICAVSVHSHQNPRKEIRFACGIPRLKTDEYIISTGFKRAEDEEGPLPEVSQANLLNEPIVLLVLNEGHNFVYRRKAKEYESAWDERLIYSPEIIERKKAA